MKDFNLVEYLREHKQGSFGMLNHYVDLKPLKEEEVPYEGPEDKLDGLGDDYEQEDAIPEVDTDDLENTMSNDAAYDDAYERMSSLADSNFEKVSPIVKNTIDSLRSDGFDDEDILNFLAKDPYMSRDKRMTSFSSANGFMEENDTTDDMYQEDPYERMRKIADDRLERLSPILKSIIDDLRDDGFDDRQIGDFLAKDPYWGKDKRVTSLFELYNDMKEDQGGFESQHKDSKDWKRFYEEGYDAGYKDGLKAARK